MNLLEAAHAFADQSGRLRTVESRRSFMKVMRHMNRWLAGSDTDLQVPLDEITADDLTDWCLTERLDGHRPSPATIRKRRAHARAFFAWAKWKGFVATNPASDLEYSVVPGSGSVRTHTWLDETQALQVLELPDDPQPIDERDRLIIMLGVFCGLRAGVEMAHLRWDWFGPDFATLTVHEGKGSKTETIGVPPQLREALRSWHRRRPYGAKAVLPRMRLVYDPGHHKRVWMVDWDNQLGYDGILQAVKKVGERHGVKLRPHDLRRSFAGILEGQGVPVSDISRALRHADVGVTSRYLDRNPSKTVEVTAGFTIGGDR